MQRELPEASPHQRPKLRIVFEPIVAPPEPPPAPCALCGRMCGWWEGGGFDRPICHDCEPFRFHPHADWRDGAVLRRAGAVIGAISREAANGA